mmetsp:Transcript_2180/g.7799  ORF Transcript_2180/g.7799 Transcript_2180/m.7799 type:complete len:221 (+) Transcript_2180:1363-2025(+)
MKMFTPGTIPFAPDGSLTCAPIRPTSATCTGAHEFGHPVQIIRTSFGKSSTDSKCSANLYAFCLVSICANPQNWFPVQATMFPTILPGFVEYRRNKSSFNSSSTFSFGTFGIKKFCSTVKRISPLPYFSANSAMRIMSSPCKRPPTTFAPTHCKPSCFWSWTPMTFLLTCVRSIKSCFAARANEFAPPGILDSTSVRKTSNPISSTNHIILAFCLLPRWP